MKKAEAAYLLGNISTHPKKEALEKAYKAYQNLYCPLYLDPKIDFHSMGYKGALSLGFLKKYNTDDHPALLRQESVYAFLKFGEVCEAHDVLSGGKEWENLRISHDIHEYERYKRNYAPETLWQRFVQLARRIVPWNRLFLLMWIVGFYLTQKGTAHPLMINVGITGYFLLRPLAFVAMPLEMLLYLPRCAVRGFKRGWLLFKPFCALLWPIGGCFSLLFYSMTLFRSKERRLREEEQYKIYQNELVDRRYAKIMECIRSYELAEERRMVTLYLAYDFVAMNPEAYEEELRQYMEEISREESLLGSALQNAERKVRQLNRKARRMERSHRRQEKIESWMVDHGTYDYDFEYEYDYALLEQHRESHAMERAELQAQQDDMEFLARYYQLRLRAEASIRLGERKLAVVHD